MVFLVVGEQDLHLKVAISDREGAIHTGCTGLPATKYYQFLYSQVLTQNHLSADLKFHCVEGRRKICYVQQSLLSVLCALI